MRHRIPFLAVALLGLTPALAATQLSVTPDVVYGHKHGMALTYDVVQPEANANGAGVLFMVSGGWFSRWTEPTSLAERTQIAALLDRGFTVYFVRHGSSPKYDVPEAASDIRLAVEHVRAHAAEHGVEPERLGITGGSAGGHLSLTIGLRAEGPDGDPTSSDRPHQLAAIVAYFPPVDLRNIVGPNETFPALDFDPEDAPDVSPLIHASSDDPPTLLIHGDADRLVPIGQSEIMHAALQEVGVTSDFVTIEGAGHGFRGEDGTRAAQLTADWFERHLTKGR